MFSWIAGESCKSSCIGADPTTDTVKFVAPDLDSEHQEQERRQEELAQRQEQLRLELEQKRAEEAERQRKEQERQEKERKEREERERLEQEEFARKQEEERLRLLEEQRRKQEEAARLEAERRRQEERVRREEQAAKQQVEAWLEKNKYAGVNTKKSKMMMARYPLHDAVSQKDANAVRLLLRFGADATVKNSSGKTPQELANTTKGCEHVVTVFASQSRQKVGGA